MRRLWWLGAALLALLALGCQEKASQTTAPPPVAKGKIAWVTDPKAAFAEAKQTGKPLMMDVMSETCRACERLDTEVWQRADVAKESTKFVAAKIVVEKYPDVPKQHIVVGYPTTIFFRSDGTEIARIRGAVPYQDMLEAMRDALGKAS